MPDRFSPETQKLLDRAQRAIEDAISLRENTRDQIASAKQQRLLLELMLRQFPPLQIKGRLNGRPLIQPRSSIHCLAMVPSVKQSAG